MKNQYLTLVDAHVHIHSNFNIEHFINSAFNNFNKNADLISPSCEFNGILCLTESQGLNYFRSLYSNLNFLEKYKLSQTNEENSFSCSNIDHKKIFFISGKQIVTTEKLEVLALGFNEDFKDGRPIEEVIDYVFSKNALPVLPWGVGKWNGKRGKKVNYLINNKSNIFFLGDNGNRPFFWKKPEIFNNAEKKGIINLPGSDPLPFISEEKRPGSFGFYFNEKVNEQTPFNDLKDKIINSKSSFSTFGKSESALRFFKNQIFMQIEKNKKN